MDNFDLRKYLAEGRLDEMSETLKKYTEEEWKYELKLNAKQARLFLYNQNSNEDFDTLKDKLVKIQHQSKIPNPVGAFEEFVENNRTNTLPNGSSGSFLTALTDTNGILYSMNFEEEGLYTDEEYDRAAKYHANLINNIKSNTSS